jgi:hypothetical protein
LRGTAALQAGRFPEARDLLRQSMQHRAHTSTAFNLVVALRGTDDPLGAFRICERLLAGEYGAISPPRRAQARQVCDEARNEVATIEVEAFGAEVITVRVDGEPAGEVGDGGTFQRRVNPGRRVVAVSAPGHAGDEQVINVERGGRAHVALRLISIATEGPPGGSSGDDSIVWWIVGGSAAAAVAIAVIVGVVVSQGSGPEGGDFPLTLTLRERF